MSIQESIPPSITQRYALRGHEQGILHLSWSLDGHTLASASIDKTIRLWNTETGEHLQWLGGHTSGVNHVAWSPDGRMLASASADWTFRIWDVNSGNSVWQQINAHIDNILALGWSPDGQTLATCSKDTAIKLWRTGTWKFLRMLVGHNEMVLGLAWSPDGSKLASCSADRSICIWDMRSETLQQTLRGHTDNINYVVWSPDGRMLASASNDQTIRLWDVALGREVRRLTGHTGAVSAVSFSPKAPLLASTSSDKTVRLWRTDSWEPVLILPETTERWWVPALAFHPHAPILATVGEGDCVIHIWELNLAVLLGTPSSLSWVQYRNAKVILIGDTGVGKSGLGLVLSGHKFIPTDSTLGRQVWLFDSQKTAIDNKRNETRETLLWDLAGQAGYRLIHQLYLNEVAVALVVFDARSETDPFAGVYYWVRALRQAQRSQGNAALPVRKFLVAARTDVPGTPASRTRIDALVQELGFDGYFETSAREERGIVKLSEAIKKAIDWQGLPKVSSTELFQRIGNFLIAERESGLLLPTVNDLYILFLQSKSALAETGDLRAQFETCIGLVESRDLIRRLGFGNLVLLQPELLDVYASALIAAVKDEPDGFGSIPEARVQTGDFFLPKDKRLDDKGQEKLLLIAMVEDLLYHEIVLREQAEGGRYLIFPSQATRENPDLPDPEGKAVTFSFEGPILNIYTTLAVRLAHSDLFRKKEVWKNAITYTTDIGGTCGMFLSNIGEGSSKLTLFFDKATSEETRFHFEEYVWAHLKRRALPESIQRRRIFVCSNCNAFISDSIVQARKERGFNWLSCPVCEIRLLLLDREERLAVTPQSRTPEIDKAADRQRDRQAAFTVVEGKKAAEDFDVFLCHHSIDKPAVKKIGEQLKEQGILPWLDEWQLRPGLPWQPLLEEQIEYIKTAAVFVGNSGIGPWQRQELDAFLRKFVERGCPVIPVLLEGAPQEPKLPVFLEGMGWVDFRQKEPDPMRRLIWGITGTRDYS